MLNVKATRTILDLREQLATAIRRGDTAQVARTAAEAELATRITMTRAYVGSLRTRAAFTEDDAVAVVFTFLADEAEAVLR